MESQDFAECVFVSTSSMEVDSRAAGKIRNREDSRGAEKKRSFCSTRPIALVCEKIWRDWVRGVPERSLSIMYRLTRPIVEDVLREQARGLLQTMRRAAVCLAIALAAHQAWSAVARPVTGGTARSFRSRRQMRRRPGLEDSGAEAVEHARAEWQLATPAVCAS